AVTLPSLAAASTYALGKVFIQHFESGGTFLDMDPDKVSAYFKEQYEYKRSADASADAKKAAKVA
ncbi:MAG: GTPase, partial [Alphaproteobacteria bacterium]|nr:GTPase [Alphaproteobacteria bacterium]